MAGIKKMKKHRSTPWSYRKGATLLHRLPAGLKLSFMLISSLAVFIPRGELGSFIVLSGMILLLIILSFIGRIGPHTLMRGSAPIFMIILGVFIFQGISISPLGINLEGLKETIIFSIRIGAAFAAGSLFFSVTTSGEIRKSLLRLEALLHLQKLHLGLGISLMLGFLPVFFVKWEEVNLSYKSRAGKSNLSRLLVCIPLTIERMLVKAAQTAEAMEARGAG